MKLLLLHQFLQRIDQLVNGFVLPGPDVLGHAGADMGGEQFPAESVQRGRGRGGLGQNIDAIGVLLHHAPDTPDLPLNAAEPVDEAFVLLLAPFFCAVLTAVTTFHLLSPFSLFPQLS